MPLSHCLNCDSVEFEQIDSKTYQCIHCGIILGTFPKKRKNRKNRNNNAGIALSKLYVPVNIYCSYCGQLLIKIGKPDQTEFQRFTNTWKNHTCENPTTTHESQYL